MRFLAALLAGLLLFASDWPLGIWPLQAIALLPLFWALTEGPEPDRPGLVGLCFGLAYGLPLLFFAGPDLAILVALLASLVQWLVVAVLAASSLRRGPIAGSLQTAALVTLLELAVWSLVPMFGTAQAFVRPLSAAPALVGFVGFSGVAGLAFLVVAWNALLCAALRGPARWQPLALGLGLLAIAGGLGLWRWNRPLGPELKVAAFGWSGERPKELLAEFERRAAEAAGQGAGLLVTPEMGIWVDDESRAEVTKRLGAIAAAHGIALAIGVDDSGRDDNRIWMFDSTGRLAAEYVKTHLVPFMEDYRAGDGTPVSMPLAGLSGGLGGVICQDDNFTDVTRRYGREGRALLAVPTWDWPSIRGYHLENSRFRPIENGYAVVRATWGGISALISPRGELLGQIDHTKSGAGLLVGDLPTGDGRATPFARFGHWPMAVASALLLFAPLARKRPRAKPKDAASEAAELSGVP
jgi:apolipoprotein N-acyltransferase